MPPGTAPSRDVSGLEDPSLENTHRILPENASVKSALVVDDSRVAQASLSRLLNKHGLSVDTMDSGSEAIDFLHLNLHPGVIFLDHMMPGMDGFETLRALKNDPRTKTVPVIMYTSTEGEAYMDQALAMGALDVLRKPIDHMELLRILRRLNVLTEPAARAAAQHQAVAASVSACPLPDRAGQNAVDRPESEIKSSLEAGRGGEADLVPAASPSADRWKRIAYAVLLLLPGLWFWQAYQQADRERRSALQEMARLTAAATGAADADPSAAWRESLAAQQRLWHARHRALTNVVAWAVNLQGPYDYDQLPLGDERLALLRELITRLGTAEFKGLVRIETHVGEFCLVRDEQGAYRLPPRQLAFNRCEVLSYSPQYAVLLGRRQSTDFARFLADPPAHIRIEIVSLGTRQPVAPYPDRAMVSTAGEWNELARQNNRVDINIIPAP